MSTKKGNSKIVKLLYVIAIMTCIVIILGAIYVILKPEKKVTPSGIEVVTPIFQDENKEVTEETAKGTAEKQFKILGENVKKDSLNVVKFQRDGEEYYYVTSIKNSVEIKVKGGQITKINSASVKE